MEPNPQEIVLLDEMHVRANSPERTRDLERHV